MREINFPLKKKKENYYHPRYTKKKKKSRQRTYSPLRAPRRTRRISEEETERERERGWKSGETLISIKKNPSCKLIDENKMDSGGKLAGPCERGCSKACK